MCIRDSSFTVSFFTANEARFKASLFPVDSTACPVSYTHLDVYKRQKLFSVSEPEAVMKRADDVLYHMDPKKPEDEELGCLLYTSRCV